MDAVVKTKYGKIQGLEEEDCFLFLGVPFALPPIDNLAFSHPKPPKPFEGIYDATKGKTNPIQGEGVASVPNNSLDCLYLNVFVPKGLKEATPVIVWIHGGSYSHGGSGAKNESGRPLEYELGFFAKETKTIVVSINYRLNLFGFLDLTSFGPSFEANNGLYDQIMALRYIKENIAFFGGDPNNVTLLGQSAGAASILALLEMHEARPYFHKAIMMSPCVDSFFSKEEGEKLTKKYLSYLHLKKEDIAPRALSNLPIRKIQKANDKLETYLVAKREFRCAFSPIVDGKTIHVFPKNGISDSSKPILIGHTKNECDLFVEPVPGFVLPFAKLLLGIKPKKMKGRLRRRISDALTDEIYINPIHDVLKAYNGMAYYYQLDYINQKYPDKGMGPYHVSDIPIVFGLDWGNHQDVNPRDVHVGRKYRAMFSYFAYKGAVNFPSFKVNEKPHIIDFDGILI